MSVEAHARILLNRLFEETIAPGDKVKDFGGKEWTVVATSKNPQDLSRWDAVGTLGAEAEVSEVTWVACRDSQDSENIAVFKYGADGVLKISGI